LTCAFCRALSLRSLSFCSHSPQPKPGNGTQQADVILNGTIRQDGGVREVSIDRSERADLNDEAMRIFSTWRFSAPLCDGKPIEVSTDVTLHFQGR
jgi:TonB family protein